MQKKCESIFKMKGEQNEKDFTACNSNVGNYARCM